MREYDKFTQLLLQDNIQKEKKWDNRFILEKIPQYDAFKDQKYLSLSLMKSKNKLEEKTNSKNNQKNIKKRIYSSHYSINSLTKKVPTQEKNTYEESFNNKNNQLNQKRPKSIYLNRKKLSFKNNINNSNSNSDLNGNQNIFYNFITNKLKTQNNININTNNNYDLNSLNEIYTSKTTKNNDINNRQNYIKYKDNISYYNSEKNSILNHNNNLLSELNNIKVIWNEIYVSQDYQNSFEEMIFNLDKEDEIINMLNNEKKQIIQFKNELFKLLNVISKREKAIENLKKLDKSFLENKRLEKYNKLIVEKYKSDSNLNTEEENVYNNGEIEEKNKKLIETDINNCLKLLRINSVNVIHQFNKFRTLNNYFITSGKIDINKLKKNYGYNPNYLIKMKNDLDFLIYSNINLIYNFKTNDPFLISLIPDNIEKGRRNFKKIDASEELLSTISNYLYILTQEELLYKIKFKKDIKRNKSSGEFKSNNDDISVRIKNSNNKGNNNINYLKLKSKNEFNKLFFKHNKIGDLSKNIYFNDNKLNKNGNRTKKIKNLYFNNQVDIKNKDNKELNEIPITSALQLQKKFDFYNKLKQDLNNEKNENEKNDSKESENKKGLNDNEEKEKEKNNAIKNDDNNGNKIKDNEKRYKKDNLEKNRDNIQEKVDKNKFNFIWFQDTFNKFKNIYSEYFNELSPKEIEIFSLDKDVDKIICGLNPKILICQKQDKDNKIYGICGISYYYDNNQLILKINHISSLEKDDNEEEDSFNHKFKIYEHFFELIKSQPHKIIELNLFIKEENKEILNFFINNFKFELYNKKKNDNNISNEKNEENINGYNNSEINNIKNNRVQKILRAYNNFDEDKLKQLIDLNEIQYNNTSILSLVEEDNNDIEQEKRVQKINMNKYFYKFINTFNLNILINFLSKDNIYSITNSSNEKISLSEDFSKYSSLFIKEKNNNSDNIINISPDYSLTETKDKIKYAYITSFLHIKLYPFISTIYNKVLYNIFKIKIHTFNKDNNIYIINSSDEKLSIYLYHCEDETELKKEIYKNSNENFNIFDFFNKLIIDKKNNENDECNDEYKFNEDKLLWLPSFIIDTQLVCDKNLILKDIIIKNNDEKKFEIKEYTEILKLKYGIEEFNDKGFIYEPNTNNDIIIDKDFIFAISHKDIKNQFNNSIIFLAYVTKENFIKSNKIFK